MKIGKLEIGPPNWQFVLVTIVIFFLNWKVGLMWLSCWLVIGAIFLVGHHLLYPEEPDDWAK